VLAEDRFPKICGSSGWYQAVSWNTAVEPGPCSPARSVACFMKQTNPIVQRQVELARYDERLIAGAHALYISPYGV
jgi:hypothetical protein